MSLKRAPRRHISGHSVDDIPAAPHAKDDEFTGGSLDSKWTNPTTSANSACIVSLSNSVLTLKTPSSGIHVAGIRQAAPSGSFSVTASIMYDSTYTFDIRGGLFVGIDGGKAHVMGPFAHDNANGAIGVTTASLTSDWSGYDGYLQTGAGLYGRYKIGWSTGTSTITFYYWGGPAAGWVSWQSRTSQSQPDHMGLAIYGNGTFGSTTPQMTFDWFRVTEP